MYAFAGESGDSLRTLPHIVQMHLLYIVEHVAVVSERRRSVNSLTGYCVVVVRNAVLQFSARLARRERKREQQYGK